MTERVLDPARADDRVDFALARAEFAAWQLHRVAAERMAAVVEVVREARRHPETYVVLRGMPTARDLAFAVEAAIADIAVRISASESVVLGLVRQGETLLDRAPAVWAAFREGEISAENAASVSAVLEGLPSEASTDAAVAARALELKALVPARFRERMRAFRERIHPDSMNDRHERAQRERRAWREHDRDGMAWLGLHVSAADAETAWQRIDGVARHLAIQDGECRTIDQLRADVAADLLTGRTDPATAPRVTVGVLVPVLTLLGIDDAPASLEGRVPIDPASARRLAAGATSFFRILTHPVSSAVLDVDRTRYRPPADLARMLQLRDVTCRFPGCGRPASSCDLDHTVAWARGGPTSASNLAHLSRRHHTIKHRTRWSVANNGDGTLTWTSPTGFRCDSDPPPF